MTEPPKLELAPPPARRSRETPRGGGRLLLLLGLLLQGGILYGVFFHWPRRGEPAPPATGAAAEERALALRLEELGVLREAARTWAAYLRSGGGESDAARAKIWYRVGKLYQEAGAYEEALAAFLRAERAGSLPAAVQQSLNERVVDCLRALGRYGALAAELRHRTGEKEPPGDPVVARCAGETLTRSAFERWLEREATRLLTTAQGGPPPDPSAREGLLKRLRAPEEAARWLRERVYEECLWRRAREEKVDQEAEVRAALRDLSRRALARLYEARHLGPKLTVTETDLAAYYATHLDRYREPGRAELALQPVADRAAGEAALKTKEKLSFPKKVTLVFGRGIVGFGPAPALERATLAAQPGTVLPEVFTLGEKCYLVKVLAKKPAREPPLAEVRAAVAEDYLREKYRDLRAALREELFRRYRVELRPEALAGEEPGGKRKGEQKP